jgi:hypothetical protein
MAPARKPGHICAQDSPENIIDGTSPRVAGRPPGIIGPLSNWRVLDYLRRLSYVDDAWTKCRTTYAWNAIVAQVGQDALDILAGILVGLLMALGVLVLTTGVGAAVGGGLGALAGGVGAIPGAVAGADVGLTVGNGILAWAGLGFLAVYVALHLNEMGKQLTTAIRTAWNSCGNASTIDTAAQEFARSVGIFVSLLIQAIVVFLSKGASKQGTVKALAQLRESLLFKHCPKLEPWLIKNFPKLRAKYVPLKWVVLEEGPLIPNTSIPESMRIRVGDREFHVFRDKAKLGFKSGEPKGPATKHLGERAQTTEGSPTLEQATKDLREQLKSDPVPPELDKLPPGLRERAIAESKKVASPEKWDKSAWSKAAQTDFPMSSLAGALDQAEAQLIFQPPSKFAKPVNIEGWELVIDTTGPVWRVEHAVYTPHPKW